MTDWDEIRRSLKGEIVPPKEAKMEPSELLGKSIEYWHSLDALVTEMGIERYIERIAQLEKELENYPKIVKNYQDSVSSLKEDLKLKVEQLQQAQAELEEFHMTDKSTLLDQTRILANKLQQAQTVVVVMRHMLLKHGYEDEQIQQQIDDFEGGEGVSRIR